MGTLVREDDALVIRFSTRSDLRLPIVDRHASFRRVVVHATALASKDEVVFHYRGNIHRRMTTRHGDLIRKLTHHWVERYGLSEVRRWFFEVWNEPNLSAFWTGSQMDYFRLYQHAARAIKDVDGALSVGGPATADNAWIDAFMNSATRARSGRLHFDASLSTDAFGKPGDDTVSQLAQSRRSVLRDEAAKARTETRVSRSY